MPPRPVIQVDIVAEDKATEELEQVEKKMAALEGDTTTIKVDASTATGNIDDLGRSASSSKSVLANMVGNTTQDLGALGGIAGSAGVAIGQMGEYMVDASNDGDKLSNVLGNFATVAGPIAALAVVMQTLSNVTKRFAESAARTTENQERWTEALRSGEDVATAYAEALTEVGTITLDLTREQGKLENVVGELNSQWYTGGIGVGLLAKALGATDDETKNLTESFAKANIHVDDFASAVAGTAEDQQRFIDAVHNTNLAAEEQAEIIAKLRQEIEDLTESRRDDAAFQSVFNPGNAPDFGHAPAAGIAAIIETNADRRAAVVNNIYNPPGTPAATADQLGTFLTRNSVRTGN